MLVKKEEELQKKGHISIQSCWVLYRLRCFDWSLIPIKVSAIAEKNIWR